MKGVIEESKIEPKDTILVVEDDEGLNRLIQKTLQRAGFSVEGALNGADAIARVVENRNVILLLDYLLPDMTGMELIETLAKRECSVPSIIMTGHGSEQIAVEMMKMGARDYIVKDSAFIDILPRVVERVCDDLDKEKRLVRAEEQLRYQASLLENVSDAVISTDMNFVIQSWNKSAESMYGWKAHEAIGKPIGALVKAEYPYDSRADVIQKFLENGYYRGEVIHHRKDGTPINIFGSVSMLKDNDGNPAGSVSVNRDITDRRRAEDALKQYSERLEEMVEERTKELQEAQEQLVRQEKLAVLGQLAGGVAHELRNPLGAIKNAVYFINMVKEEPEPETKEALEILEKEVGASERIISSLLDFARPNPPILRKVNINDVVTEALSQSNVPKNIKVVNQLNEALPSIFADPKQLAQAFGNIIENAIQAMTLPRPIGTAEGGQLIVKSEVLRSEWLTVSFTDTGVGIPGENLSKLFAPLFTTKAKGIGLGLVLAESLVEGHGGAIEVKSRDGEGSTFTVRLPIGGEKGN